MAAPYPINVFWSDEDGAWVADVPDLGFALPWVTRRTKPSPRSRWRSKRGWERPGHPDAQSRRPPLVQSTPRKL